MGSTVDDDEYAHADNRANERRVAMMSGDGERVDGGDRRRRCRRLRAAITVRNADR